MNSAHKIKDNLGFSLVELSVVIVIMGMMLTAGLKYLTVQSENASYSATLKNQETIKLALISYFRTHKSMPCPDTKPAGGNAGVFSTTNIPDGIENRNSATASPPDINQTCDSNFGIVPYQTLGLSRDVALDGWENYMSYRIYYPASGTENDWVRAINFKSGNSGAITVKDRYPANSATANDKTSNAVVAIISHGKNGLGAYTVKGTKNVSPSPNTLDEYQNTVGTGNIFSRDLSEDTSNIDYGVFDDLVTYLTSSDILEPLFKEGSVQTPEAQTLAEMDTLSNGIVARVLADSSDCATPLNLALAGFSGEFLTDAWGSDYAYSENLKEIQDDGDAKDNDDNSVNESIHIAFSIISYGANKVIGGGDDLIRSMTAADLISKLTNASLLEQCP